MRTKAGRTTRVETRCIRRTSKTQKILEEREGGEQKEKEGRERGEGEGKSTSCSCGSNVTKKERERRWWTRECYPGSSITKCNSGLVKLARAREITLKPAVSTRARLGNAVTGIMLRESTSATATATAMAMAAAVVSSHPRDPGVAW